jgi:hypothetical protein
MLKALRLTPWTEQKVMDQLTIQEHITARFRDQLEEEPNLKPEIKTEAEFSRFRILNRITPMQHITPMKLRSTCR